MIIWSGPLMVHCGQTPHATKNLLELGVPAGGRDSQDEVEFGARSCRLDAVC